MTYAQTIPMTKSFKEIIAWQKSHQFTLAVYDVTKSFPEEEKFGLTSQFRRAAVSIPANIAEGYKKLGKADKLRFLNTSQGSLEECRYYIILSKDLGYIDSETHDYLENLIENASYFLNTYIKGVKESNHPKDEI